MEIEGRAVVYDVRELDTLSNEQCIRRIWYLHLCMLRLSIQSEYGLSLPPV